MRNTRSTDPKALVELANNYATTYLRTAKVAEQCHWLRCRCSHLNSIDSIPQQQQQMFWQILSTKLSGLRGLAWVGGVAGMGGGCGPVKYGRGQCKVNKVFATNQTRKPNNNDGSSCRVVHWKNM